MKNQINKQKGTILFVVLMVMVMLSILVMMAVQNSKTNTQISLAQAQQIEAFDNAEAMLSRIRFALEQVPIPPSIAKNSQPDGLDTVIWEPQLLANNVNGGSTSVEEPLYAQHQFGWNATKAMTCDEVTAWLRRNKSAVDMDCGGTFPTDKDTQPLVFIEFITKQQSVSDIDDIRGAYFFRITVLGRGFHSGRNIVQGVTGVQYI